MFGMCSQNYPQMFLDGSVEKFTMHEL